MVFALTSKDVTQTQIYVDRYQTDGETWTDSENDSVSIGTMKGESILCAFCVLHTFAQVLQAISRIKFAIFTT